MLSTLIVEDNAAHRQSLHDLLARQFPSMRIAEAVDGEEALRETLARRFDLVFMDIRLPRGNGLSLCQAIKTAWADAVVCILTSYDIEEYREAAFRSSADYFMVKGDSSEAEIVGVVDSLLHTHFVSLIISSDPHAHGHLNSLLAGHWPGMIVEAAHNASDGLAHVLSLKPDLVLLELRLPGIDIVEMAQLIRSISEKSLLVGLVGETLANPHKIATPSWLDFCVSTAPLDHARLVNFVSALHPWQVRH